MMALLLGLALAQGETPAPSPATLSCETRLVYAGRPEAPHRLVTVYAGHDRVRWQRRLEGAAETVRDVEFRVGRQFFVLPQGESRSRLLEGEDAVSVLLRFELRRALLEWPAGLAWREEPDGTRTADIGGPNGEESVGRIRARLDGDGRPEELWIVRDTPERLLVRSWREDEGRLWPAEFELRLGERLLWTETLVSATRRVEVLDVYFLPPDRRERRPGGPIPFDVVARTERRLPLAGHPDLPSALRAWAEAAADPNNDPGLPLDPVPTFELDEAGRPAALVLRLAAFSEDPPAGWTSRPEGPGLTMLALGPADLTAELLEGIRGRIPDGHGSRAPYVRIAGPTGSPRIQLVLPLVPPSRADVGR